MTNIYILLISIILLSSCSKNNDIPSDYCYEINELSLSFYIADTVCFQQKTKISASINKPLEITLKIDSLEIGTIYQQGSIIWIPKPEQFKSGENYLSAQVRYCSLKGMGSSVFSQTKKIIITNMSN